MDVTLWLQLIAFIVLMAMSGFFSSSETSLFSLDAVRLEQMRRDDAARTTLIERLLNQPRRLIVTILIGNELVNVAASVISASVIIQLMGAENKWLNLFVMVPLLLFFGEITPKTLAIRNNVAFARIQAAPIEYFARLVTPLRWIVRKISDFFITIAVGSERSPTNIITEDMVRSLAREAVGEGVLDKQEAEYINQIFNFGDLEVRDVMTPRSQVFALSEDMSLADMVREIHTTRHTKVPVYDESREIILGMLFARDLLGVDLSVHRNPSRRSLARFLRKTYFVPETKPAADLFRTFRSRKLSVAATVDEYGGVTGLVTMEDLLECIFGEIPSGSEILKEGQVNWQQLEDGRFRIDASMTVRQFNEISGAAFSDDEAETAGGLVLHAFGELPHDGDSIDIEGWRFTVERVAKHRIQDLLIARSDAPEALAEADVAAEPMLRDGT